MKIGDTIRDIEDGDCYFEGIATEIEDGKVTKYLLKKIVWSDEIDENDDRLNTEIEPQWWYIQQVKTDNTIYNMKVEREDIENMVRGIYPDYCAFNIPIVKQCGSYVGGMVDKWRWDWSEIQSLDIDDLVKLYMMCKISHKQKDKK